MANSGGAVARRRLSTVASSGASRLKATIRTLRHRGSIPWLVEPVAQGYAQAQWMQQRWLLRSYQPRVWAEMRTDPARAVEFAFEAYGRAFEPLQSRSELVQFAELMQAMRPRTVVELGTARGGTFFVLVQMASEDATLVSVDLPGGIGGSGYPRWKEPVLASFASPGQSVHLIRANSHHEPTAARVRAACSGQPVDLLFIDADHSYAGVKRDYELYSPLVRPGGLICLHDVVPNPYNDAIEVDRYWQTLAGAGQGQVLRDPDDLPCFGIGILRV